LKIEDKDLTRTAGNNVPFPPPLAFIVGMALGFALQLFLPARVVTSPRGERNLVLLASGLLSVSASLVIASVISFRRARTTHSFSVASTSLIVRGPFRISRNPLYLAGLLFHAGVSLLANALWPLMLLVPAIALVNTLIKREETYLTKRFGREYDAYRDRVRRWI
jgi:protein-S-isoprenylcysteine O-methyltransferase Ste14